jgi:hypothetical protein
MEPKGVVSVVNKLEPEPRQPAPDAPWHAGWLKAAAAVAGSVIIIAAIIGIWGPLWPTAPAFYPETPSPESPLELSFKVKNRSALFGLRNLQIVCMLVSARSQSNKSFAETGVTLSQPVVDLAPGQSEMYSCPLHVAVDLREGDKIVRAKIDFISQYDSRWPWGGRSKSESDVFTLNTSPPQWLAGENGASTTASR